MKRKKFKNIIIATTAMALLTTSIPLNLVTSATTDGGGVGGGNKYGFGSVSDVNDDALDAFEIGLRFSLVTVKDGQRQLVQNGAGKYYLDIWPQGFNGSYAYSYVPNYDTCNFNTENRYGISAERSNITAVGALSFDNNINSWILEQGVNAIGNVHFSDILNPAKSTATFVTSSFAIQGINFYDWFMGNGGTINGQEKMVYSLVMQYLYRNSLSELDFNNTFLVVEPILYLSNADGVNSNNTFATTGALSVSSWYGYINHNIKQGHDPGNAISIRDRMSRVGSGFKFASNETVTQEELTHIQNVLGLSIPQIDLPETNGSCFNFADKNYNVYGYGIQAFWLKDLDEPVKDPVDTYDIENDPTDPDKPETPSTEPKEPNDNEKLTFDNTGEKTIIKTYVDLYQDANNSSYYTKAVDSGTFIETGTSSEVVISDESDANGGYEVVAWYTSQTDPFLIEENTEETLKSLKGSSMLSVTDSTDDMHKAIGKEQFTIDGYQPIESIELTGSQSYANIPTDGFKSNAEQYTKNLDKTALGDRIAKDTPNDTGELDYNPEEYIDLGDDKTIVLLYVREHGWINTKDFGYGKGTGTGTGDGTPDTGTGTGTGDDDDKQGELKIVKCYGMVNPATYEIEKDTEQYENGVVRAENVTRNVNIQSEPGYRLAEYVYSTRDNNGDIHWDTMDASKWGAISSTPTKQDDTNFSMKGFIDGFSGAYGSGLYSEKYAWADTEQPVGSFNTTYTSELTYPGTYGTGLLSGNSLANDYANTIYFDMQDSSNTDTQDDVLYLLFLKEDKPKYKADNFVIPESFITRHNDFATNNITVKWDSGTAGTTTYLFAQHKFKYALPLVTGINEAEGDSITNWTDSHIIASIEQTNTSSDSGLIGKWSKTEFIQFDTDNNKIGKRISTDNSYRLAYNKPQLTPGILSFTNANYSYTAYRKDDKPTLAEWKLEQLDSLSADSTQSMDTSSVNLEAWKAGAGAFQTINSESTDICAYGNDIGGTRKPDDYKFSLSLNFTDNKAKDNGENMSNVPELNAETSEISVLTESKNNIIRTATANIKGESKNITMKSEYISELSSLEDLVQEITCEVYSAGNAGSAYIDEVKPEFSGSGTGAQAGGAQIMSASNTIKFRPYHVMQYDTNTLFNTYKKANGEVDTTGNKSAIGQVYVLGEKMRELNCYSYAGVSFTSGSAKNEATGTINIVNNMESASSTRGKIAISSEQWSTHARAIASTENRQSCVLPGGAQLSLSIPKDNQQAVTVTTYIPVLAGNGLAQVNATGNAGGTFTDLATIDSTHAQLVKEVARGIESLNVQQYVDSTIVCDRTADENAVISLPSKNLWENGTGQAVGAGESYNGLTLSTEDKYYFRDDGDMEHSDENNPKPIDGLQGSSETLKDGSATTGDLDTSAYTGENFTADTTKTFYTFYVNRVGEVWVTISNDLNESASRANVTGRDGEQVTDRAGNIITSNAEVQLIAEKTEIVNQLKTHLVAGDASNDVAAQWADDSGHWYYEAFDGLTIAAYSTQLNVGFIDSFERTSILDPKLTPTANSKGDILTKYVYSQFKMKNKSMKYASDEDGENKIGEVTLYGQTASIKVPDLSTLFVSDIFIIPNATVQDLK